MSFLADVDKFAEDVTAPLLLGYVRRELLVSDVQIREVERQMASFARIRGFSMGFTFVEEPGNWPMAFEDLIRSVDRYQVTAVVLPSLLHFAVLEASHDIKDMFQRATGARVLLLDSP